MADTIDRRDDGFEIDGEFYTWKVTDHAKDLMLIDRFSGMPVTEFFQQIEDSFDRGRATILLSLIATSIRGKHPEWSVERVARTVMDVSLSEVTFIEADAEEQPVPPAEAGTEPAVSDSQPGESSSSSTHQETLSSETLSGIPV